MALFEQEELEHDSHSQADSRAGKALLFVLGIPFLPAVLFGLLFYWIFLRTLKFRRSVSTLIALTIVAIAGIFIATSQAVPRLLSAVMDFNRLGENWPQTLYFAIPFSLALGALLGLGYILWEVKDILNNPHRVELPGFWTYKLKWRKTPLELWRMKRSIGALKSGALMDGDRSPLGYEENRDRVGYRFVEEARRHTIITGAAGSGKTISMLALMRADIEAGRTVVAVDFKRSPEFAAKLAAWAHEFEIPFYHFEKGSPESYRIQHSQGQSTYDPFASGSGSEMVLNMREYDSASAVYKQHMQQLLQIIFAMMEQADRSKAPEVDWDHGGIYMLASCLTDANLNDLLIACEGKPIFHEASEYVPLALSSKSGMESHALEQLRGQMRTIVASAYGRWFKIGDGSRNIDLLKMMTQDQTIILFSFNSEDEPELSRYVGSMIFADLRAVSSHIRNTKASRDTNVYVDEFQAVPPTAVTGLLEKARESRIAMTLAQQAFEQIITSTQGGSGVGEAYLDSILVTCSNFLIHAGMTQNSAERVSKLLGKEWKTVYARTNKSSGGFLKNNFSNRRDQIVSASNQEVWRIEPSEIMQLSAPSSANGHKSTAILVSKAVADPAVEARGTIARTLWMIPPSIVLDEYVTPVVGDEAVAEAENLYASAQSELFVAGEAGDRSTGSEHFEENAPQSQDEFNFDQYSHGDEDHQPQDYSGDFDGAFEQIDLSAEGEIEEDDFTIEELDGADDDDLLGSFDLKSPPPARRLPREEPQRREQLPQRQQPRRRSPGAEPQAPQKPIGKTAGLPRGIPNSADEPEDEALPDF